MVATASSSTGRTKGRARTRVVPLLASDYVVQAYTTRPDALSTTGDIWRSHVPRADTNPAGHRGAGSGHQGA